MAPASGSDNDCPRIRAETFLEYVQRRRELAFGEVAAFASWEKINRALEQVAGDIYTDIGLEGGVSGTPPWPAARWDADTWLLAMKYLDAVRLREDQSPMIGITIGRRFGRGGETIARPQADGAAGQGPGVLPADSDPGPAGRAGIPLE